MFRPRREQEPGSNAPGPAARPGAFLGTLRSEFDEPEAVPKGFHKLHENVEALLDAYEEGRLTKRELAERLARQRAVDNDGGEWTVGATTRSWYRRRGPLDMWMQVPPPSQAIGEPRPGVWQSALEIPEAPVPAPVEQSAPVRAAAPVDEEESDGPERRMEFPAEYIPAGAAAANAMLPVSYEDHFDAGLAKLLSGGTESPLSEVESAEDLGPAPRAGIGTKELGLGTGAYLEDDENASGRYLDEGSTLGYLDEDDLPETSYGDFLEAGKSEGDDPQPEAPSKAEDAALAPGDEDLFLPDDFFWDDDKKS